MARDPGDLKTGNLVRKVISDALDVPVPWKISWPRTRIFKPTGRRA